MASLFETFQNPPKKYSLIPFWFLNDDLEEAELKRQIDDFYDHGVYGFVPHARMGLSEEYPFMSENWCAMVRMLVEYAASKEMQVILYDEGMYPSGSCAGEVVRKNPRHAARCLERRKKGAELTGDDVLVAEDDTYCYVNSRSNGHIRGVHFGTDDGEPGAPPAGDILHPDSVGSFLHLVCDRYYEAMPEYFGTTVSCIFTDEPSKLGRGAKKNVQPWTWELEVWLEETLGYDIRPKLAALWEPGFPEAKTIKAEFDAAINKRLEEFYYAPYSKWCADHGIMLTGHPAQPGDIGTLKYFQLPGQDVVWRYLEPFKPSALEGPQSTMGKCSFSAQEHYERERNLNEYLGAYGWELTWEEMRWLTNWLLVRGTNLLSPHAFYYSIRGPRRDERPPDVGPNNVWWDDYKPYADYCRRVSWLLAEGQQVCDIAILGTPTYLPWRAAKVLFESQWDFNYLDTDTLISRATVTKDGIAIGKQHYTLLLIDGQDTLSDDALETLKPMIKAGRVVSIEEAALKKAIAVTPLADLPAYLAETLKPDVTLTPAHPDIRFHHVRFGDADAYFFTNEGAEQVESNVATAASPARGEWWDPDTGARLASESPYRLRLAPYTGKVLMLPEG